MALRKKLMTGLIAICTIAACGTLANKSNTESTQKNSDETTVSTTKKQDYTLANVAVEKDAFSSYVTGVLTNQTNSKKGYVQISFNVYNKDKNKVGTAFANINDLEPNGTWKFKAMYIGTETDITIDTEKPEIDGF